MTEEARAPLGRALWYMTSLAFRADPLRAGAALFISALLACVTPGVAFLVSRTIAAALERDVEMATGVAAAAAALAIAGLGASLARLDLRFRMEESTGMLVDRDIIALTTGIPGLEQHERPEHLDRLELLRTQRRMLGGSVGALIENAGTFASMVTTTGLLATVDARLLLLPLFGVPSVLASAQSRRWLQRVEELTAERTRAAKHLFELATTGPPAKELRVFGLREEIRGRYDRLNGEVDRELDRTVAKAMAVSTAGWSVFAVGYIGAIAFSVREAVAGRASPADVILVLSLAGQVNQEVAGVYWTVGWLLDTLKTVGRYLRLMDDAAAARPIVVEPAPAPDRLVHGIDMVNVSFRYPGTSADVLRNVELHLPAGSTVAVVGDNGAGKSTLVKLLSRFYDPTEGVIEVDGIDLRRIPVDEWRLRMAAGFQDFAKLELLARETVGVGDLPWIDDAEVVDGALGRASARDVVSDLAQGLETPVGRSFEGGLELSGGQWQKLALGRAMMRGRPLLLVLDEPTAALDADTEHALFQRYAGAARSVAAETGGITVLVSHRFSTVRMADLILVVGDGNIVESGTHEELIARRGTYAELYELQARAYR